MPFSALKHFFSSPKYIALFFIAVLAISLITPVITVYAQTLNNTTPLPQTTSSQNSNYLAPNTDSNVPQNQHTYVQSLFIEIVSSLNCMVAGTDPINPRNQCLGIDQTTGKIGYVQSRGGMIGMTGNLIAEMYTPPASSSDYIHYLSDNFGITKHTYAATDIGGSGSSISNSPANVSSSIGSVGLRPLLGIWSTFRNISYLFFVLGFIIIGFAIMLRLKIDPRTVMTIQNQIPKIIIGLLLITFSYAIAGIMIDLMYASTYLMFNIIGPTITKSGPELTAAQKGFNGENPVGFASDLLHLTDFSKATSGQVGDQIQNLVQIHVGTSGDKRASWGSVFATAAATGLTGAAVCSIVPGVGTLACGGIGLAAGAIGGVARIFMPSLSGAIENKVIEGVGYALDGLAMALTFLIVSCAMIIMLLRIWWILLKAYIAILVDVILAPLWIMGGLLPGSSLTFSTWFRHLTAHLAVFPATIAIFLIARSITDNFSPGNGQLFVPPLIGNPTSDFSFIIAFGFLMVTPNLMNIIREALKSKPSPHSGAPTQGFMMGLAPVRMGFSRAWRPANHQTGQGPGFLRSAARLNFSNRKGAVAWQGIFDRIAGGTKANKAP